MQQPLLDTINNILCYTSWWNKQLRGSYSGDISDGTKVPHGIAEMLFVKSKYSGADSAATLLQRYHEIAAKRLKQYSHQGFFKMRKPDTTSHFYQLLSELNIESIQPEDEQKFVAFYKQIQAHMTTPLVRSSTTGPAAHTLSPRKWTI